MKINEIAHFEAPQPQGGLPSVLDVKRQAGIVMGHVSYMRHNRGRILWPTTAEIDVAAHAELDKRLHAANRCTNGRYFAGAQLIVARAASEELVPDPADLCVHRPVSGSVQNVSGSMAGVNE